MKGLFIIWGLPIALALTIPIGNILGRVKALEATMEACCSTEYGNTMLEADLELIVNLRKEVTDLRARVEQLEK